MKRFKPTAMQESMLYEMQNSQGRYITTLRYALSKPVDEETLSRRMARLIRRHEILRTRLIRDDEGALRLEAAEDDAGHFCVFLTEKTGELTVRFNHVLLDGWSVGILMRELMSGGEALESVSPFRYYSKWLERRNTADDLRWWRDYLNGTGTCSQLPNKMNADGYERRELRFLIENSGLLKDTAQKLKITPARLLQAVWCMLIARYNGGESIVCTVNTGRGVPVPGIIGMAGMCVNTLPIVTKLPKPPERISFSKWVYDWSRQTAEAERHGFCALGDLIRGFMPHILSIDPPFDSEDFRLISSSAELVTDFDVSFTLSEVMTAEFDYNARAYSDEAVKAVKEHFMTALNAVLDNPGISLEQIPILTDIEISEMTAPNEDAEIFSIIGRQTVIDFWRESVKLHENNAALVCGDTRLTYAALSNAAERLSGALKEKGVGRETPAAILLPRSERYVIAELAVWLAGGMFVPLDPKWPQDRIQTILTEISPAIVISETVYDELLALDCKLSVANGQLPQDAAYIIMTSGTTGTPKGVVVEHRSFANFCLWARERYGIKPGDSCALELGFTFDGSFWSIWPPLISGGTVHIVPDEVRFNMAALGDYCASERITHIDLPVSLMEAFREIYGGENVLSDLRITVTGGEEVRRVVPAPYALSNEYGPTECTVCCSASWPGENDFPVSIGLPVTNMNAYILDEWGRLCPDGVIGEACFSGVQVARGYYNAPELTAKRFIENPFNNGASMYKTGDLMFRNQHRELVFVGRADNQVKINGFRIELAEIENVLRGHSAVTAASAAVRETPAGGKQIYAFVIGTADEHEMYAMIDARLPAFMRPVIAVVDSIPLTSSGKIDFERLEIRERISAGDVMPVTESEKILVSAISRVLAIENIGMNHNYLELGGNSINAMRISYCLEKEGYTLSAKELITSASIGEAAAKMLSVSDEKTIGVDSAVFTPLPAQTAMMFLNETAGSDMYAVTVKLSAEGLRGDELGRRLDKAAKLHDILRTAFETDETGRVYGRVGDTLNPSVSCVLHDGNLTLRYHHIALDGHSANMLIRELLYGEFPETAPSFAVFANRLAAQEERRADDEAWWRNQCRDAKAVQLLPIKTGKKPEYRRVTVCLPQMLIKCTQTAQKLRVTPAAFALTAWGVVLDALGGGGGDIFVPFVASCRDDERLMGMCAAALPLVFRSCGESFGELARRVQEDMLDSASHWFVPQDIISRQQDYLFVFEDGAADFTADGEQNYDLVIKFSEKCEIIYNAARLPDSGAGRIAEYLDAALTAALENRVSILSEKEDVLLTEKFAHGRKLDVIYKTAAEAFTAAADIFAERTALETENGPVNYAALYTRARELADKLNGQGIGAGDIVAFSLPRNAEGIIAQLGITLSGAAFLPLDPEWPEGRKNDVLSDCGAAAIIKRGLAIEITGECAKVPDDTAYIIYTSGTTGKPKGAVLPQKALANQIAWAIDEFDFTPEDKMLHYIAFTFDPSVWVIFTALASGASLSLLPEAVRLDPDACARHITGKNITRCTLPAAVAPDILCRVKNTGLRTIFLGGEVIRNLPPCSFEIINCYGPTEACINAAFYRVPSGFSGTRVIGFPVANTSCFVLDKHARPCPVGVQGEIFLGGVQLAHGYLNRPDETAAVFLTHPRFGRIYRTGDRAAWNADGTLTFFGRWDNQVKIRGNRVELSEIEYALREIPGVSDARVLYKDGALDAYVTAAAEKVDTAFLKNRLPSYMLPRSVTVMDCFPLTENGKVDFEAFPAPFVPVGENTEALSELEHVIASVWKSALGLAPDFVIKRGDSFNDLGGHSLLLFHVVGLLSAKGINADIKTLIEYAVLGDLAEAVSRREMKSAPKPSANNAVNFKAYTRYIQEIESVDLAEKRALHNILITGGTGFLGSHLVYEFFEHTGAVIHLPVRNDTAKLRKSLEYYFGEKGTEIASSKRVRVYLADISENPPDISERLDIICHTAADIRHYAPEPEMYRANVTATEHMITLAKRNPGALLTHISTTSAVNSPEIYETDRDLGPEFDNVYQRTKQLAEQRVFYEGERGLKYAIFRVGHVSPGFKSGSVARNWEINAMLRLINAMLLTELLPEQDYKIGYGYADKIARAIRLLSTPVSLADCVFHIDNPNTLRLSEIFRLAGLKGTVMPKAGLTARLTELLDSRDAAVRLAASEYLGRLAQGSLEKDSSDVVAGKVYMDATLALLERLGFQWPDMTGEYIQNVIHSLRNKGGTPK